jgi:hypothetical protein
VIWSDLNRRSWSTSVNDALYRLANEIFRDGRLFSTRSHCNLLFLQNEQDLRQNVLVVGLVLKNEYHSVPYSTLRAYLCEVQVFYLWSGFAELLKYTI